jgi:hypothetical protein
MCCRTLNTPAKLTRNAANRWPFGASTLLTPRNGTGNTARWRIATHVGWLWTDGGHYRTNNITQGTPPIFHRGSSAHDTCRWVSTTVRPASRLAIRALFIAKAARRRDPITGTRVLLGHERNATVGRAENGAENGGRNADATKRGTRDATGGTQSTNADTHTNAAGGRTLTDSEPCACPAHLGRP